MEIEALPPSRPNNWRKHTVIIACAAIVCILMIIVYVRLETVKREETGQGYGTGYGVVRGTCGGLLEGNKGNLSFVHESTQDEADTSSSSCLWIIHLRNETNIRFTLTALGEDAVLNLCSGDKLASCSMSSYTKRLNSTHVGSSFEFLGKTLIVVLPISSASVTFSWQLVATERVQATDLTNLKAKGTVVGDGLETLTEEMQNLTVSQGIVEGIIAGTTKGVVIIPLDSLEQTKISSEDIRGVAFNWQSRKVYWVQHRAGIMIANLDGSSRELLIADNNYYASSIIGLAVDQVTGNFYYGDRRESNPCIRVCDSLGKKCATVVSGVHNVGEFMMDIALFPSEGLIFWSSPDDKKSVTRANMDGTNSTIIILEEIYGLFLDEYAEKLYWASYNDKSIGHRDLNGYSRNILLNTTMNPFDIAADRDTLYFTGDSPNGVYSVNSDRKVSTIANTSSGLYHIALYGRNKGSSRQNPCKNSPCVNLCVLSRVPDSHDFNRRSNDDDATLAQYLNQWDALLGTPRLEEDLFNLAQR